MRAAIRSGSRAPARIASNELCIESGQLRHDCNYIARTHGSGCNHAGIEATHTPARRARITLLHLLIVDFVLERLTIKVELGAGTAWLSDLQQCSARANLVAETDIAHIQSARREILAQRSRKQWISARDQCIDGLGGDQENGFAVAAVDIRMRMAVTFDPERGDKSLPDRPLGESAERNVHLDDCAFHSEPWRATPFRMSIRVHPWLKMIFTASSVVALRALLFFVAHHFLDALQIAPYLVAGVLNLVGVVDHAWRQEYDQLRAGLAVALRAEGGSQQWNPVEHRHSRGIIRLGFLDKAAECDGVPVLHRYLSAESAAGKRR